MNDGSSEEEACSEEEARGSQDRSGEKDDGEEDGHRPSQDDRQKEIASGLHLKRARGLVPAPLYFPL